MSTSVCAAIRQGTTRGRATFNSATNFTDIVTCPLLNIYMFCCSWSYLSSTWPTSTPPTTRARIPSATALGARCICSTKSCHVCADGIPLATSWGARKRVSKIVRPFFGLAARALNRVRLNQVALCSTLSYSLSIESSCRAPSARGNGSSRHLTGTVIRCPSSSAAALYDIISRKAKSTAKAAQGVLVRLGLRRSGAPAVG